MELEYYGFLEPKSIYTGVKGGVLMRIQNNLLGINTSNSNKKIFSKIEKSLKKMSSGYRINIAADDAAGLTISEKMRAQIRGLIEASKNAIDASSMMQVRDGALDEVHHIMKRMRELTIQSLNGTLTDEDRGKIQKEFRALQVAISDITKESEWNTKPLFEAHEASFYSFEGNQKLDKLIKIIDGLNNDLEVSVDGNVTNIYLDEGFYSIGEIADIIDTKLFEKNPNLIINLTEKNSISLQSENSLSIDHIKGGLSFLFYEYHIGNPPGMIIGVTEFLENGRLNIISGHNDKLKFYVGASKEYTIDFVPKTGGYSIDELIGIINTQLTAKGEMDVKAIKYSKKHIALYSDKHVITGLSGNMIKIDGITSVLYDNAKYGNILESQGYVAGRKNLTGGININKGLNDILEMKINNEVDFKTIKLLDDDENNRTYTFDELINKINIETKKQGLDIIAENSGGNLRIRSNYFGYGSKVILGSNSNAYEDLFVGKNETLIGPDVSLGTITSGTINGRYVIDDNIEIKAGENDTLELTVDGVTKTIQLEEKNYIRDDLINEINTKLNDSGLNATAELLGPSGTKYAISISNNKIGEGTISISQNSNGFKPLFCEPYFNVLENKVGETKTKNNEEGIVGPIEIIETSAVLTGRVNLNKTTIIDGTNDRLKFNMSGEIIEINLDHGSYNASELSYMLSSKLSEKPIDVSLKNNPGYGTNLVFTTQNKGDGQYFKDISGTAYSTILASTAYIIPSTSSTGISSKYSITGKVEIENNFVVNDTNNKLSFNYLAEDIGYDVEIELTEETYINCNHLIDELNIKIQAKLVELNLNGDEILAINYGSKIRLTIKETGPNYELKDFSGTFYDAVFKKQNISEYHPYSYSGYTNPKDEQLTYIVGREDLNKEVVIHPYVNDILIFDFYHNANKQTFELRLAPGLYNASSIVSEIQDKLGEELTQKGFDPKMLEVQIGGIDSGTAIDDENKLVIKYAPKDGENNNGNYIIDGVRGSAAYTVFYKAQGEPSPTHTIGIVDLSNGVNITAGVNDTFIMDINGEPKTIVLEEKEYTSEELLSYINGKLGEMFTNVVASYYEGRLKLSFSEVGANTIDGIRGNAKGTLFFNIDRRESDEPERFQIGANAGNILVFNKPRVSTELMRINTITIHKPSFANKALVRIDNAINYVSNERGRIGATQNRLDSIVRSNENYGENLSAAESRIRDSDMAKEVMELTKQKILEQVTHAMLAQANKQSEGIIDLLR